MDDYLSGLRPQLRAFIARRVAPADVDDVLQETLSSIWAASSGEATGESRAVAFRIAERRVVDHYRARSRQQRTLRAVHDMNPPVQADSALDEVLAQTPPAWLYQLSTEALEVLLRFIDGASVAEIAADLQISPNAVSSRLKRIRQTAPRLIDGDRRDQP